MIVYTVSGLILVVEVKFCDVIFAGAISGGQSAGRGRRFDGGGASELFGWLSRLGASVHSVARSEKAAPSLCGIFYQVSHPFYGIRNSSNTDSEKEPFLRIIIIIIIKKEKK